MHASFQTRFDFTEAKKFTASLLTTLALSDCSQATVTPSGLHT
jgi:hypothetical protein